MLSILVASKRSAWPVGHRAAKRESGPTVVPRWLAPFVCALLSAVVPDQGHAQQCVPEPSGSAQATGFGVPAGYVGQCGFPLAPDGRGIALPASLFADSRACGRCVELVGPAGSTVAPVVDLTAGNAFELTEPLFTQVTGAASGIHPITWRFVACPVAGPARLTLEGANPFFLKFRPLNHRYGIDRASIDLGSGTVVQVPRSPFNDNAFIYQPTAGAIPTPYRVRLADVHGREVVVTMNGFMNGIAYDADPDQNGGQFPFCPDIFKDGFE